VSVLRAPDQGVHVGVGLTGGSTEIGVERLGAELRCSAGQGDLVLTRGLALADPARADLNALRDDPEVGLMRRHLIENGEDDDVGATRPLRLLPLRRLTKSRVS